MPTLIDTGQSERGWSRLETVLRCPQLFAYKYLLADQIVSLQSRAPLNKGSLVHVGLAHLYARAKALACGEDPDLYYDVPTAMRLAAQRKYGEEHFALTYAAVEAYAAHWAGIDANYDVIGVEMPVEATVRGHRFTKRIDLITRNKRTGRYRLTDHKSTSRMDKTTERRYRLSGGVLSMQWFGEAFYGEEFEGAFLNLIELDDPFRFKRIAPEPAPAMLMALPQTVQDAEERIASLEGRDPWHYPRAMSEQVCETRYGQCEHAELCAWGPSARSVSQ